MLQIKTCLCVASLILLLQSVGCIECDDGDCGPESYLQNDSSPKLKYVINDQYLYAVADTLLLTIDISENKNPIIIRSQAFHDWADTLYVNQKRLFIGSVHSTHMYDLNNSTSPEFIGSLTIFSSCDGIAFKNDFVYIAKHEDSTCDYIQYDVIEKLDISNPVNPQLATSTLETVTPYSLATYGEVLYVCQGENGLNLLNSEDLSVIRTLNSNVRYITIEYPYLTASGPEAIYQYDISEPSNPALLSHFKIDFE